MKKLLGVVVALVSLNSSAEAEFWSIGSFNVFANGVVEQNRISELTELPVQIETFTVGDLSIYRLLVEKDGYPLKQQQKIMAAGITPWSLGAVDALWAKRQQEMAMESNITIELANSSSVTESPETPVSKPKLSPPNAGESYFDYCIKKANAVERIVYCSDGSFTSRVLAEKTAMSEAETAMSEG